MHTVFCERAGLVGTNHGGRTEGLHRTEPLDQGALASEGANSDAQREGDRREESFGNVADEQANGKDRGGRKRQAGRERPERKEREPDQDRNERNDPGHSAHLTFERTFAGSVLLRERGDAAELGMHAGGEDQCASLARGAGRTAEHQVGGIEEGAAALIDPSCSHRRNRLAGQHGCIDLDVSGKEPRVGRYSVAFLDREDVAWNQLGGFDRLPPSVPDYLGLGREILTEQFDGALCLLFLDERERCVEHDDHCDRDRDGD